MIDHNDNKDCIDFLPVDLTDEETLQLGKDQGMALQDRDHLEDQLKEYKDSIKAKISAKDTIIKNCSKLITQGFEFRNVDCYWKYDWDANMKYLVRKDTESIVQTTNISLHERQETMAVVEDAIPEEKCPGELNTDDPEAA